MYDMNFKPARSAELFFSLAVVIILVAYAFIGSVDIIFKDGGREVHRIENATVLSELAGPEGDDSVYSYTDDFGDHAFSDAADFRFEIVKNVFINFFTFRWEESDNVIVLYKQVQE